MKLTHIAITNWRNFAHIEFDLSSRLFVVGPNSSGKTNLLGALRFLGDIGRRGLVAASEDLGGPDDTFVLARILPLSSRRSTIPRTRRNSLCFFG